MPELTSEFITALSLFVTTIVGAIVALRREFHKVEDQVGEVHQLVNSAHTEVKDKLKDVRSDLTDARAEITDLKAERNDHPGTWAADEPTGGEHGPQA
jgi:SMC interacting uncharacterized protein involved in chromosome segregation